MFILISRKFQFQKKINIFKNNIMFNIGDIKKKIESISKFKKTMKIVINIL